MADLSDFRLAQNFPVSPFVSSGDRAICKWVGLKKGASDPVFELDPGAAAGSSDRILILPCGSWLSSQGSHASKYVSPVSRSM